MSIVIRSYGSWISPFDRVEQHLRARDLQLEALAAHLLDEHGQLELAAAADLERLGGLGGQDLDRDVAEDLAVQPGLDLAARSRTCPRGRESGEVFAPKVMLSVGSSTSRRGSGRGSAGSVSVSPIVTSGRPATATMSPARRLLDVDALDAVRRRQAGDRAGQRRRAAGLHGTRRCRRPPRGPPTMRWPSRIEPFQIRPTAMRPT